MENDKDQTVEKDEETMTSTQEGTQETSAIKTDQILMLLLREMKRKKNKTENRYTRQEE